MNMKRDMDLARRILFSIEESEHSPFRWIDLNYPEHSSEKVAYHVRILAEAGLIEALDFTTRGRFDWKPKRLTWHGHEFLDAARSDTLWEQAKAKMREHTSGLGADLLKAVLQDLGKQALGI